MDKWVVLEVSKASKICITKTITRQLSSQMISILLLDLVWANSNSRWHHPRPKAAIEEHRIKEAIRNSTIVEWTAGWIIPTRTSSLNKTTTQRLEICSIWTPVADKWFKESTPWSQRPQNEMSWQQMISQSKRLNIQSILSLQSKR